MKNKIIIIMLIILMAFSGCNVNTENNQPEKEQLSTEKTSRETPKELESIEESIEKIFLSLNGPASNIEKNNQESKNNSGKKKEDNNNNQDNKDEGEKDEGENENNQTEKEETNENNSKDNEQNNWVEIDSTINKLHYQWNSFISFAMEINTSAELIDNFSMALNNLTNMILNRDQVNSLMAANNLYAYIPDFYMLFDTPYSPEIKRLRHYTRSAMLNIFIENWADSEKDLQNLKSSWSFYKNSIQKERPERANKLDYSIHEFEMVINEKNKSLSSIKGKVTLNNIDVLENEQKENSK